jgi:hypothetical protein
MNWRLLAIWVGLVAFVIIFAFAFTSFAFITGLIDHRPGPMATVSRALLSLAIADRVLARHYTGSWSGLVAGVHWEVPR